MEFERAKQIGDEGERLVAAELERLAPEYGLSILNDVLLQVGTMTAQLDHLVIDRFGVLILEAKVRSGALIRGNDVEKRWTACYPGRNIAFQNPLLQNMQHENAMRQALKQAGSPLDPDYVKSAVVIAGANLSQLELDSLARARVVDIGDVEGLIRQRHDFAPNSGSLSAEQVAALAGLLRGLNRAQDAAVADKHAVSRGGVAAATRAQTSFRGSIPTSRQVTSAELAARPGSRSSADAQMMGCVARLVLLGVMFLLFWWFFMGPGQASLIRLFMPNFRPSAESVVSPELPPGVSRGSIQHAKSVLREAAPDLYDKVANLDSPEVTQVPQGTTYTWDYVEAKGAKATVMKIALTLDASGKLVGVDMQ